MLHHYALHAAKAVNAHFGGGPPILGGPPMRGLGGPPIIGGPPIYPIGGPRIPIIGGIGPP